MKNSIPKSFCLWAGILLGLLLHGQTAQADTTKEWTSVPSGPFHWQLQGTLDVNNAIRVVGADLFDTSADQVAAWRAAGQYPICYINVGAVEDWRDDAMAFPQDVIGAPYWGWDGENWLDISRFELFANVITARLDLCRDKGFLAIEPDNIDAYEADQSSKPTGFDITRADQLRYVNWLIKEAHLRGLAIGQKNVADLVPDLVGQMDFALLESSYRLGFMAEFDPYIGQGKPVFAVEYVDEGADPAAFCPAARAHGFQGVIARTDLDRGPQNCP
ncbi:endo alpha-1,4 polygalactosaminidase [Thalassospira tepidiphila]|uniref:endo alpha-1,4 polygalactosaminidase n=1 Tax=Thalassospira tepidiphila TaxID=393657 RepID=UPI00291D88DB|nr:endo alpha-1,4 polygalactosaminidase [Thalassospira tepidiphila]